MTLHSQATAFAEARLSSFRKNDPPLVERMLFQTSYCIILLSSVSQGNTSEQHTSLLYAGKRKSVQESQVYSFIKVRLNCPISSRTQNESCS